MASKAMIIGSNVNTKASIEQFFQYMQSLEKNDKSPAAIYKTVAFAFRCVQLRANALATIPWEVVRGETETEWPINMERLWWQTEAALLHYGAAYWLKQRNRVVLKDLQYLNPATMKPKTDPFRGVVGFEQDIKGRKIRYSPDEIVYFRYWDPTNDLAPGVAPMRVIAEAAGLAAAVNEWGAAFFERGAIPAVILSTDQDPPDEEIERVRTMWQQLVGGVHKAFRTMALRYGYKATVISPPVKDLGMPDLTTSVRQQIAIAFGVPESMVGDPASNYATARTNRISFYQDTIIPEATQIEATVNEQLFEPMGLEFHFQTGQIEAIQQDEAEKSKGVVRLYEAGIMTLQEARDYFDLGEAPPELLEEDEEPEPESAPVQEPAPPDTSKMIADLRKWRTKARKRGACEFESDEIPPGIYQCIKDMMGADVESAFLFLKILPEAREAAETRLTQQIASRLNGRIDEIAAAVAGGQEPNYAALETDLQQTLQTELARQATEQALREAAAIGIDIDVAVINTAALQWAREYSYELVSGLTETTKNLVGEVIAHFVETPGMSVGDVRDMLTPAFGQVRAQLIGVTELTRAFSMGTEIYQEMLRGYGLDMEEVWETSADERVCPMCGPLHGQPESVWKSRFPHGPPAHPGCRCWVNLRMR